MHLQGFPIGSRRLVDPEDLGIQAFFEGGVLVRVDEYGTDLTAAAHNGPSAEPDTEPVLVPEPEPPPQEPHEPGPEPDAAPGAGLHETGEGEAAAA